MKRKSRNRKTEHLSPEERERKLKQALTLGRQQLGWIHGGASGQCADNCCQWSCCVSY